MTYPTLQEIADLVRDFEAGCLPHLQWTHQAHLTVGFWYLLHYPRPEAVARIRSGIQHYNQSVGIANTPTSGYHETLTQFWIQQIQTFIQAESVEKLTLPVWQKLLQQYNDPKLPWQYYSHERLMSEQARAGWLEPDLRSNSKP
jgi:hypothetical protein